MNGSIFTIGAGTPGVHRAPMSAAERLRRFLAALVIGTMTLLGIQAAPAVAAVGDGGVGSISKSLDSIQSGGFTAPNTFATGSLVRYSLAIGCSSLTTNCGASYITDVLDPNLEYVGIVQPTQTTAPIIPVSASASGQTVTINVGSTTVPFPDGAKLNIVLVAKVRSTATGTIPNVATLTTNLGTTTSQIVNITTPPATANTIITKTASPTTVGPGETTYYTLRLFNPTPYGNLDVTNVTVVDTLPAGVEVVDAAGGTVSGNTITWSNLGPQSFPLSYCGSTGCYSSWAVGITIRFPNPPYVGGEVTTNTAVANFTYANGSTGSSTASVNVSVTTPTYGARFAKTGNALVMAGEKYIWNVEAINTSNVTVHNWTITDTLPSTYGFDHYTIDQISSSSYPLYYPPYSPVKFEYQDAAGVWQTLLNWVPTSSTVAGPNFANLTIPGTALAWRMTADSVAPAQRFSMPFYAYVPATAAVGSTFQNCATLTGVGVPSTVGQSCVTTTVRVPYTQSSIFKNHVFADTTATSQKPGDEFWFTLGYLKMGGQDVTNIDLSDQLPSAFEFIPGTVCGNDQIYSGRTPGEVTSLFYNPPWYGGCTLPEPDPTIVANSPTAGVTSLQWTNLPVPTGAQDGSHYFSVAFKVRVKDGTAIANYTNNTNVHVNGVVNTCSTGYYGITTGTESGVDLNGNGTTNDAYCANTNAVQVREAAITSSYKWVKGDVGTNVFESTGTSTPGSTDTVTACPDAFGGYTRYPCVAEVNPTGTFDYKFDIVNQGNIPLTEYAFYDVLPHIGDVGVNQALATSGRLTDWTPYLTGPVTPENAPAGSNFTVLYSLSYDPCRPELSAPIPGVNWQGSACTDPVGGTNVQNTWYTQTQIEAMAGTWANVKSFKVVMFEGVTTAAGAWQPAVHVYFDAPMAAPQNAPASSLSPLDLSVAWNSLGDQVAAINPTTGELMPQLSAAPRKVGIIVPAVPQVQVGDYVWIDTNADGLQAAGEPALPGVVLVLTGPDGNPVTDVFGNLVGPQTTDSAGYYLFPNLPVLTSGSYTVTIDQTASATALAGYTPTTSGAGSDRALDSSTWTASSTGLTVDGQKDLTLDFGFISQPVSIGDYVWLDNNRDGLQTSGEPGVAGVVVTLKDASGGTVGTYTTLADGYYWFTNLAPGANYTLTFTQPSGYSWTTQNVSGVTDNNLTTDGTDSDVNPTDGTIAFTAPTTGSNGSGAPDKTDNPTLDGGLVQINLQLQKTGGTWTGLLLPGTEVTWTLTPSNAGPSTSLSNWTVTDVIPSGLQIVSMGGTGYTCDIATAPTAPVCTSSSALAPGTPGAPITVVTKVVAGWTASSLHNVAYISPATGEVTETNALVIPTTSTITSTSTTDNDAEASINVVSVGDYVWVDADRDGVQDSGEAPVVDATVTLYAADGTTPLATMTTDATGHYWFTGLLPSTAYVIGFDLSTVTNPVGTPFFTLPNAGGVTSNGATTDVTDSDAVPATVSAQQATVAFTSQSTGNNLGGANVADNPGIDAGIVIYNLTLAKTLKTAGPFVPGQTVTYELTPHNDGPAAALSGWSVTDLLPADLTVTSVVGGATYSCTNTATTVTCTSNAPLAAATNGPVITVTATLSATFSGVAKNVAYVSPAGTDGPETKPLVVPTLGTDTTTNTTDNDAEATLEVKKVSVGDYVWVDVDRDGVQDAGEAPVAGVTVTLYAKDGTTLIGTTTTDATGHYWFTGLLPSTAYVIGFDISTVTDPALATAFFTLPNAGADTSNSATTDVTDSDAVPATVSAQQAKVSFTSQASGSNLGGANVADNPGIDAGIAVYNLKLVKTLTTAGPFVPGQTVTYTLAPSNDGPTAALAGWSVTDLLPAGLTVASVSGGSTYDCTGSTSATVVCTSNAALAAGSAPVITVTATLSSTFAGSAKNVAYVSPASTDGPETNVLVIPTLATDTTTSGTDNDAQATLEVQKVSIGDYVWWDINRDGLQGDPTVEPPIAGMTVSLLDAAGNPVLVGGVPVTTVTDANGYYAFTDLLPNTAYTVVFVKSSLAATADASFTKLGGGDLALDSNANPADGTATVTTPSTGNNLGDATQADDPTIDAGLVKYNLRLSKTLVTAGPYYPGLTVTYTLIPSNDGPADALAGWSVTDVLPTGMTFVSMTGDGTYSCAANVCTSSVPLPQGDGAPITVTATIDAGFIGTANNVAYVAPAGANGPDGPDVAETNPLGEPVVQDGDTDSTGTDNDAQAALQVLPVSIGDYVWYDRNRDGQQGAPADEPVVPGVVVNLLNAAGNPVLVGGVPVTTVTDPNGYYAFTDLAPHTAYIVEFVKPANTVFTDALTGATATDSNADVVTGRATVTTKDSGLNLAAPGQADDPTIDAGLVEWVRPINGVSGVHLVRGSRRPACGRRR